VEERSRTVNLYEFLAAVQTTPAAIRVGTREIPLKDLNFEELEELPAEGCSGYATLYVTFGDRRFQIEIDWSEL
jgi:hypothetical protein